MQCAGSDYILDNSLSMNTFIFMILVGGRSVFFKRVAQSLAQCIEGHVMFSSTCYKDFINIMM